jgi:hypothetical protein
MVPRSTKEFIVEGSFVRLRVRESRRRPKSNRFAKTRDKEWVDLDSRAAAVYMTFKTLSF